MKKENARTRPALPYPRHTKSLAHAPSDLHPKSSDTPQAKGEIHGGVGKEDA